MAKVQGRGDKRTSPSRSMQSGPQWPHTTHHLPLLPHRCRHRGQPRSRRRHPNLLPRQLRQLVARIAIRIAKAMRAWDGVLRPVHGTGGWCRTVASAAQGRCSIGSAQLQTCHVLVTSMQAGWRSYRGCGHSPSSYNSWVHEDPIIGLQPLRTGCWNKIGAKSHADRKSVV